MTEHEQLKEICDKINHTAPNWTQINYSQWMGLYYTEIDWDELEDYPLCEDVREIIFTPEFMEKFITKKPTWHACNLLQNLDNPVQYLYNLIK